MAIANTLFLNFVFVGFETDSDDPCGSIEPLLRIDIVNKHVVVERTQGVVSSASRAIEFYQTVPGYRVHDHARFSQKSDLDQVIKFCNPERDD